MKKKYLFAIVFSIFLIGFISAVCELEPSLINQDPYPAVPGDYVTLIFQLKGVEDSECKTVNFELIEGYPIKFDPNVTSKVTVKAGTYVKDYVSYLRVPYKVRVDSNAIDGDNKIEVRYSSGSQDIYVTKSFNLSVKDVKSEFEVFVKNYDPNAGKITFEILNVGKNDVEALTMNIKQSDNLIIRGPLTNIVGSLDSNDFTTADFDVLAKKGSINVEISYTDSINERRTVSKNVFFDPEPFKNKAEAENKVSPTYYIIGLLVITGVIYLFYRRHKNKKNRLNHRVHH